MRTSTRASPPPQLALPAAVEHRVGVIAQRNVEQQHEAAERDRLLHRLLERDDDHGDEDHRRDHRPVRRAAPGRRLAEPLHPRLARTLAAVRLGVGRPGLAAGAAAVLDDAGGVAAVLRASLALGLGHYSCFFETRYSMKLRRSSRVARLRTGRSSGNPANASSGASPTNSASATRAWRATASTARASGTARWSSTFIETWATPPRAARLRPIARRPGRPSRPLSRIRAAIALASSSVAGGASSTLKAMSGGRAATSVAPAVGCGRGGPKSGWSSPSAMRRASAAGPPRRSSARVR